MPRKQRFKPSRKPKPAPETSGEPMTNDQGRQGEHPAAPQPSIDPGDIERSGGMRTRDDIASPH